ncbi:unannotated protein [freshwater metagenome]|uniref:Unannotated protein n=1 Tax=freshwater metagenome TaxID=449393 RepID=A0A6J6UI72_9ZZZZ
MNTKRIPATSEILSKEPKRLNCPRRPKSGVAITSDGIAGTFRFQPFGFVFPVGPSNSGPILKADSSAIATAVETMIAIRIAPLTFLTISPIINRRPKQNTTIGQPTRVPPSPSVTGTGPVPVRRTKPASTRPISAMNRPIPTEIAIFSCAGTARNTAVLKPVRTRTVIMIPSRRTSPIASAHDIFDAIPTATNVLRPRPVASASGKFPTTPIRIVSTPAINAVAAAIAARLGASPPPRNFPSASFDRPMINGLSATM